MARQEAIVTPSVMKWAREKAGFDIATAAQRIGRATQDIKAWENGSLRPTLAQARRAAVIYKRSLAVFYLPEPPKDFGTLRDFRHLPDGQPSEYSPELALLIRRVWARQEWLRDFLIAGGAEKLQFVGSAKIDDNAAEVAASIRRELGITPADQMACNTRRDALWLWIERAEDCGVSVCREGKIECEEARGLLLTDSFAPFIYLNSSDALVAQAFTLLHELAHLWIDEPGISNLEGLDRPGKNLSDMVEIFCNRIASEALLDEVAFSRQWQALGTKLSLKEKIENVSAQFKVSEEAIARRLLDRQIISTDRYNQLRAYYRDRWRDYAQRRKEKPGGGHYYYTKVASNGRVFTQTVLSACRSAFITIRDASVLLGVKANHLTELASYAGIPAALGT
ncbi:MAG: ImmA/IrrE family metallo-endopeptidase [Sedimentisphaerales bacterium]|nr:ImmA/IrrE family metallo-endopeptidase [Sedimentisphaerales bacterium]